ncbi:Protein of unknown function [Pyronema omphalodes CBS 100304]|uniref:Uncharacterized protein n=1 Tax=Pyronema omphalodes (strain CBS 100304) TaxID=1076935 RepID=U4L1Z8_PYROM|nr:Protein of unknown function [Pyronema omphalodes CBS 100304]
MIFSITGQLNITYPILWGRVPSVYFRLQHVLPDQWSHVRHTGPAIICW